MIYPTIGRIVWFHARDDANKALGEQACAAIVCYVWSDRLVNLSVFDPSGVQHSRMAIILVQDGDTLPNAPYCEWMPFQKGQAAKYEALAAAKA